MTQKEIIAQFPENFQKAFRLKITANNKLSVHSPDMNYSTFLPLEYKKHKFYMRERDLGEFGESYEFGVDMLYNCTLNIYKGNAMCHLSIFGY